MREAALLHKKKKFINWFLEAYRLKQPEAARILRFLSERDELLRRVHFVENIRRLPNALLISAENAVTVSFLCRIDDVYYEDIDEIISVLSYYPPEELFVWLSFDREFLCDMCDIVLGVRPEIESKIFYHRVIKDLEKELNFKIRTRAERKAKLLAEIDEALKDGDKERFMSLSDLYRELLD